MKKLRVSCISLLIIASFLASYWLNNGKRDATHDLLASAKIVTLAPSSGEVVCALGLGHQLVGVSRFATYPPEVMDKPKVGGYLNLDLEAVLRLKPDVVILLEEQMALRDQLEQLGLEVLLVDHMSVEGILGSISIIGKRFGKTTESDILCQSLKKKIKQVQMKSSSKEDRKILISIGRELGQGKVTKIVAAGAAGYHQQLLEIAGYTNAYMGDESFPQLSRENLIRMNPDIIIDMINTADAESIKEGTILDDWLSCSELNAVKGENIFLLVGDVHFVPGPRLIQTLQFLDQCLERPVDNAE